MESVDTVMVVVAALMLSVPAVWGFWQTTQMSRDMEHRMDAMQAEIDDLRESRQADHEEMRDLRDGISLLVEQIRQAKMDPVWTPDEVKRKPRASAAGLAVRLAAEFSSEELDGLAFEMGVGHDQFGGETIEARARELVRYMDARGRLTELRQRADRLRPRNGRR